MFFHHKQKWGTKIFTIANIGYEDHNKNITKYTLNAMLFFNMMDFSMSYLET